MWEIVELGDVCELVYGKALDKDKRNETEGFPAYGANGIKTFADEPLYEKPSIIIGRKGSAGEINFVNEPFWALDVTYYVRHDEKLVGLDYLYHILKQQNLPSLARGVKPGINRNDVYSISVKIPPLAEQQRIVANLTALFTEIDTAIELTRKKEETLIKLKASLLSESLSEKE
jgi:type I restriction enzyme, S subunit